MSELYGWLFGRVLELDMTGHGPPWPFAVFNPETNAFEPVSAERSDGEMRWQGLFRPDSTYYVGDVVRAGTSLYVCTQRPIPVQESKADTFTRADQDGWGTASDAEEWVLQGTALTPPATTISGNQGLSATDASFNVDQPFLGAPMASANAELLVRWSVAVSTGANDGVALQLSNSPVLAAVSRDGGYFLRVEGATTSAPLWAGGAAGTLFWTRFRQDRGEIKIRTWADGTTEPTAWDAEWDSGVPYPSGGSVALANASNTASSTVTFDSLTVAMLRRELASPGADAAHWDLMV